MNNDAVEKQLKSEAESALQEKKKQEAEQHEDPGHGFEFVAGEPLPADVVNPLPGEDYHRCVDLQGRYQPKWMAFNLQRSEGGQERIPFKTGADRYSVQTGVWCDVPPHLVKRVRGMVTEVTEMVDAGPIKAGVPARHVEVVRKIPTFHFQALPSA